MKFTQKQISIIGGGVLLLAIIFAAIYFGVRPSSQNQKVTLTVWGTDPSNVFEDMATAYKTADPGATINYTQIDPADYSQTLLKAFAAGDGPDLFEIGNRELPKWQSVAAPIPATLATSFNLSTLQNDFPTVVGQDFVANDQVYALPLDLDTLAMYYNKDIFDSAGIVYPPTNWNEFETDIGKLRIVNGENQITRAAAAIGGSETSIANAPDLVFLLMLQNGTQMISSDGTTATFNGSGGAGATNSNGGDPGLDAFNFYLQFANSASPYYTWSDSMGDAVQSFIAGNAAILFDYASAMPIIKAQQPFLNFGVAAMPQPASSTIAVNYPQYMGLAVSRQGQIAAAWQFILFATANPAGEAVYTKDTGEPPATRAYIASNLNDPTYGVFASQALTARSWYEADDTQIDSIMNAAIQSVLNGSTDSSHALGTAQDSVTSVMAAANQ
jgi:ABC-type glycerol-3-phosphate transport system substrate-binding protein